VLFAGSIMLMSISHEDTEVTLVTHVILDFILIFTHFSHFGELALDNGVVAFTPGPHNVFAV